MKKQLRFTKRGKEISTLYKNIEIHQRFSIGEAMDVILQEHDFDVVRDSIIMLEQNCEDWGVTEELFIYFAETLLTFEEDDQEGLLPKTKLLISKLNKKFNGI